MSWDGFPDWGEAEAGRTYLDVELGGFRWTGSRWERAALLVCAWCTSVMGVAEDFEPGNLTHGVCPKCRPKIDAEIAAIARDLAPKCCHGNPVGEWCTACESET